MTGLFARSLSKHCQGARDASGGIGIAFALFIFLMLGVISLAVDYGRSAKDRSGLHQALRNATVYAAESYKMLHIRKIVGAARPRPDDLFPTIDVTETQAMERLRDYVREQLTQNLGAEGLCVLMPRLTSNSRGEVILDVQAGIPQHRRFAIFSAPSSCDCEGEAVTGEGCSVAESGKLIFLHPRSEEEMNREITVQFRVLRTPEETQRGVAKVYALIQKASRQLLLGNAQFDASTTVACDAPERAPEECAADILYGLTGGNVLEVR